MKTRFRHFAIRQAIYFVDLLESLCYAWQTELRSKLAESGEASQKIASPPSPVFSSVSDFRLGWRLAQACFSLVGLIGVVAFFNTLKQPYLAFFVVVAVAGYGVVFLAVRHIYHAIGATTPLENSLPASRGETEPTAKTEPADESRRHPDEVHSFDLDGIGRVSVRRTRKKVTAAGFDDRMRQRLAELSK